LFRGLGFHHGLPTELRAAHNQRPLARARIIAPPWRESIRPENRLSRPTKSATMTG
jgi:hypothetical protein